MPMSAVSSEASATSLLLLLLRMGRGLPGEKKKGEKTLLSRGKKKKKKGGPGGKGFRDSGLSFPPATRKEGKKKSHARDATRVARGVVPRLLWWTDGGGKKTLLIT